MKGNDTMTTEHLAQDATTTTPEVNADDANALWERAAVVLRQQVSEAGWFSTFNDISVERGGPKLGGNMSLHLRVPNAFVRERVLTRYMSLVRDALDEVGASDRELDVDVQSSATLDAAERATPAPTLGLDTAPQPVRVSDGTARTPPRRAAELEPLTAAGFSVSVSGRSVTIAWQTSRPAVSQLW